MYMYIAEIKSTKMNNYDHQNYNELVELEDDKLKSPV